MSTRDYSDKQEQEIARRMGGRVQSNSGGTKFGGGDVLTDKFLIEAKTATKETKSFVIQKEWLEKAKEQAFQQRKQYSALAIRFDPDVNEDYYIIPQSLFWELLRHLEEGGE